MLRPPHWIVGLWLLVNTGNTVLAAETQNKVLAIYSDRTNLVSNVLIDETLRSVLTTRFKVPIDFRSEHINNVSPISERTSLALRDFLRNKYAGDSFNVIVGVGPDALRFIRGYGQELFPGVPIVSWGSRDLINNWGAGPPMTGVLEPETTAHVQGVLDFILTLQPDVRQVFVVSGISEVDRQKELPARKALGKYENRVTLTYLVGLPLEELEKRLTHLPEKTAVFFLRMNEDGGGRVLLTRDVLVRVAQTTNAPIYALSAVNLGSGIVGGLLMDQETMARDAAEIVLRLLGGEQIRNIPLQESHAMPMVDSRQLRRWKISEDRLPPDTTVLYKEASVWKLYKWRIIGVISLCIVEGLLILALLIQQTKRKRAEQDAARNHELLQSTIDALDAHIALLDENAYIIAVNESWRRFAKTYGYTGADCGIGTSYLEVCKSSTGCEEARLVHEGLQALITGESSGFCRIYECSHGTSECWFQLRASRFLIQGELRLVLAHENITEIRRSHDIQQQLTGLLLRAQDEERRRIARDLHDVTVQNIATIKADLIRAQGASKSLEAHVHKTLVQSRSLCDQVIKELRTLSYLLHPPLLDEAGLVAALQWYIRGFVERSGIDVDILVIENIGRLPLEVETALFRVVQESLTNIHRHSGSGSAVIWVTKDEGEIVVRVQDDGHGMPERPADRPKMPGVGILGMRQRLKQLGGRLEIESNSQGTTVTARVPTVPKEGYVAYSRG